MAVEWTGLGPELLVQLDRTAHEPLGAQLQRELREAIRTGRLAAGERLPSSRSLAGELGVSRGLVVDCYVQLEAEGYLTSHVGSGTRVADGVGDQAVDGVDEDAVAIGVPLAPPGAQRLEIDFEYGVPDEASFPMRDWVWALAEAGRTVPIAAMGDVERAGSGPLRQVLAAYLRRVRGASARPEQIVTCAGFRQGLNVVFRALADTGVVDVALEDPGPMDHDVLAERAGLRPIAVPVDEHGIDVEALGATPARAVVLTPAHQCPTGVVLAPDRRQQLVAWAHGVDGIVVEDDYDAEFRYDRQPVGSMQGLAPDRVVAMGSVSKTLAPALRQGWIVAPPQLLTAIVDEQQFASRGAPVLDQLALAHLIESGRFDRHIRHMRGVYRQRREVLVGAVAEHAPGVELAGLAAGCHAVLRLSDDADERHVVEQARERSIGLYGMSRYRADGATDPPEVVVGFGNVTASAITRGVAAVADLLVGR